MRSVRVAAEARVPSDRPPDAWPLGDRVPTLTEVVELDSLFPATEIPSDEAGLVLPEAPAARAASAASEPASAYASELGAEVLFELEQRIGSALEARLRDALAPALARAADGLIREAKHELAQTLRELVDESVTRALERRTHL